MKKAYSPTDIVKIKIETLPFEGEWAEAFGTPAVNETWFISGKSSSGKSSFVMQLAKMLCRFGKVLYISLEEQISPSFQKRLRLFSMNEVQGKFSVILDADMDELRERLHRPKSAHFIIIDSLQYAEWEYKPLKKFVDDEFPDKSFIFISQESKGRPMGKVAEKVKYMAGVKIRTIGFRAYCQGRFAGEDSTFYTIWAEKAAQHWHTKDNKAEFIDGEEAD